MMRYNRRSIYGIARGLGNPARLPPQPHSYRMTDRDDGTLWYLIIDTEEELVGISTDAPADLVTTDLVTLGPYEGPYVQSKQGLRLLIRGGYLGYETVLDPYDIDSPRVYAGVGPAASRYEIVDGNWATDGDMLGFVVP